MPSDPVLPKISIDRKLWASAMAVKVTVTSIPFSMRKSTAEVSSASTSRRPPSSRSRLGTEVRTSAHTDCGSPKRVQR